MNLRDHDTLNDLRESANIAIISGNNPTAVTIQLVRLRQAVIQLQDELQRQIEFESRRARQPQTGHPYTGELVTNQNNDPPTE